MAFTVLMTSNGFPVERIPSEGTAPKDTSQRCEAKALFALAIAVPECPDACCRNGARTNAFELIT